MKCDIALLNECRAMQVKNLPKVPTKWLGLGFKKATNYTTKPQLPRQRYSKKFNFNKSIFWHEFCLKSDKIGVKTKHALKCMETQYRSSFKGSRRDWVRLCSEIKNKNQANGTYSGYVK